VLCGTKRERERRRESVMKKSARESKRLRVSMRERGWEKERGRILCVRVKKKDLNSKNEIDSGCKR